MVKVKDDLTGKVFGRLTVKQQVEDYIMPCGQHAAKWLCECSCEDHTLVAVIGYNLKKANGTRSCGCIQKEIAAKQLSQKQKQYNMYDLSGQYGIGFTHNTNQRFYFDLEDYDKIKDYCWSEHIDNTGYHSLEAWDSQLKKLIKMHFVIAGKNHDHKNRNPLDNRKENLRPANIYQNAQNRGISKRNKSGIIGVIWHKDKCVWEASLKYEKQNIYLGGYANKEDAIKARLSAEAIYFKDFAPQKHLFDKYDISYSKEGGINE